MRLLFAFGLGLFVGWLATNYSDTPKEQVRANLAGLYNLFSR
jgi:hypothetical protein